MLDAEQCREWVVKRCDGELGDLTWGSSALGFLVCPILMGILGVDGVRMGYLRLGHDENYFMRQYGE